MENGVRWGILGTAGIARGAFLPGLRAAGGRAYAVAGRDPQHTARFASEEGIERAYEGYESLLADPAVEAVYIPLPNALHSQWTKAALRAGKTVLCEKPLCLSVEQVDEVLEVARTSNGLLWEAFVFPFRAQTARLTELIERGEIGEVREIQGNFHFPLDDPENIRLDPELGGGGLYDVGCYPIRLAQTVFQETPVQGAAVARRAPSWVDVDLQGALAYPDKKMLMLSCGMDRPFDRFTRIIGTGGEIRLTDPYHPTIHDTLEVRRGTDVRVERLAGDEPSFTPALQHMNAVIRGQEEPRHVAIDESRPTAVGIDLLRNAAARGDTGR